MTRKRRRLMLGGLAMLGLASATALALSAFDDNLLFFYSPTDIAERPADGTRAFRLGGLVEEGSVAPVGADGLTVGFTVTDNRHTVPVVYTGLLPDLFREEQGVITEGTLGSDGVFVADSVLAKHDERYMPREAVEALKEAGQWRPAEPE